jgi:hypothetical protein
MATAIQPPRLVVLQRAAVLSRNCGERLEQLALGQLETERARLAALVAAGGFMYLTDGRKGTDRHQRWAEVVMEGEVYLIAGPYDRDETKLGEPPQVERIEHVRRATAADRGL